MQGYILGIGDSIHDRSVCLMKDGRIQIAIEEERLTRIKHGMIYDQKNYTIQNDGSYMYEHFINIPSSQREIVHQQSIQYCLDALGILEKDIDFQVVSSLYPTPAFKQESILLDHHMAHAASAFYPSPFQEAAILTLDGSGECIDGLYETVMYGYGMGNHIKPLHFLYGKNQFTKKEEKDGIKETLITLGNSIGAFYKNISVLIGMGNFGEGKTMGLASYGEKRTELFDQLKELIELKSNGELSIYNRDIFLLCQNWVNQAQQELTEEKLLQFYADLAYVCQSLTEEMVIHCAKYLYQLTRSKNLCLAGGVALNGVANYRILSETPFEEIFIQPAAGDNGLAIGCAMFGSFFLRRQKRESRSFFFPYLGKTYSPQEIKQSVQRNDEYLYEVKIDNLYESVAQMIHEGKIIGWFQGGSEIGPRALGNRSILANPTLPDMKQILNDRVKHREGFRPFAPMVLKEDTSEYFHLLTETSPYMLLVTPTVDSTKAIIPAVTHVDGSARVQTVSLESNPKIYLLIKAFKDITGVPVLLNTSFNDNEEPIVESPEDAIRCFLNVDMDALVIHDQLFIKKNNNRALQDMGES